jgi:hypothetical protein
LKQQKNSMIQSLFPKAVALLMLSAHYRH